VIEVDHIVVQSVHIALFISVRG